jgi:hypothetical protein
VCVEGFWRDVSVVRPDDRARLWIGAQLAKVPGIAERLEDSAVIGEVGQVDVGADAVLETNVDVVAVQRSGLEEKGGATHGWMVERLYERIDRPKRLVFTSTPPVVAQLGLVRTRPLDHQPHRRGGIPPARTVRLSISIETSSSP